MRAAHTYRPNTSDPQVCKAHDATCKRPSCAIATRMVPEGITKAVRTSTYRQYLADANVGFEPRQYMAPREPRPQPLDRTVGSALVEFDPAARTYKGQRQANTNMRAAFLAALGKEA